MANDRYCETKEPENLYKIGMFSRMNHVTVKALRHYDEIGLLKPSYVDKWNGYRYYTSKQLPDLHQIIALRDMGFSLEEIRQVQEGMPESELLNRKKREILNEIAEKTAMLSRVECYLAGDSKSMEYPVVLKELPEVIVASIRRQLEGYDSLFSLLPPMGQEMERLGCECAVPEYCFNIYHDGGYREEDIDAEICEAVTEMKEDSAMIQFKVIPKVEMAACLLHKGNYRALPKSYSAMLRYIEENGYEIADLPRESYIDGVWNKDTEEEWLTELQFPVRKK